MEPVSSGYTEDGGKNFHRNFGKYILKCLEPLLRNDSEMAGYNRAVSGQRLDRRFPRNAYERNN